MFKRVRVKKLLSRNNVVNIKVLSPSHVASRQIFPISNIHKSKLSDDILTSTRKFSLNIGSHFLTTRSFKHCLSLPKDLWNLPQRF